MKKIFTFLALVMISAMSWAAVSITVTPNKVDFGTVSMKGHEATGVEDSVTFDVTYTGLQQYCGVVYEDDVMPEEDAAFWISGTSTSGWIYGGDTYTEPEGQGLKVHYYASAPGNYTGRFKFYSYKDAYWEVRSDSVYLDVTVNVISGELPKIEYTLVNSTSDLKEGDVVVFGNASAQKVAISHNKTNLAVTDATITGNKLEVIEAMEFTVGKESGKWTFTNNGQKLGGNDKSLVMGSGTMTWAVSISNGEAEIKPTGSSYPIMFNEDRFKLYDPNTSSYPLAQLYKKASSPATGIENTEAEMKAQKVIREGRVMIMRGEAVYTVTGVKVE